MLMINRKTLTLACLATLVITIAAFSAKTRRSGAAAASDDASHDNWEYLVVAGASNVSFPSGASGSSITRKESTASGFGIEDLTLEQHLDRLGAKGWELVSVSGSPTRPVYYLKRRKQ